MKVVLIGGGGHASDVLSVFEAAYETLGEHPVIGVLDDGEPDPSRFEGRGVGKIGSTSQPGNEATHYVLAVGWPASRKRLHKNISAFVQLQPTSIIHPDATVHDSARIGQGTVIMAGARVSAGVVIGDHVLIHHDAVIGHDCHVGDFASVMPGATVSGDTVIESGALIGTGAAVIQGLCIHEGATVGAGAVATRDVSPAVTVVGLPAREAQPTMTTA